MNNHLICPRCDSQEIGKHGFYEVKAGWRRRWKCKHCEKTFSNSTIDDETLEERAQQQSEALDEIVTEKQKKKIGGRAKDQIETIFSDRKDAKYSIQQILDVLIYIALNGEFLTGGADAYQERKEEKTPAGNTVYKVLKPLDVEETIKALDVITKQIMKKIEKSDGFQSVCEVAVDEHDWPFYGDDDAEGVIRTKEKNGTTKAYQFMTICVVTDGQRVTLGVVPITDRGAVEIRDAVAKLIEKAQKQVCISCLYADRGFYQALIIKLLKEEGISFCIRAKRGKTIKETFRESPEDVYIGEYTVKRKRAAPYMQVDTTLVVSKREGKGPIAFVTNMKLDREKANKMVERYRKRWGIETSYRMIRTFLAKTTSRKHQVRVGLFVIAVVLYNLWILENALLTGEERMTAVQYAGVINPLYERSCIEWMLLGMLIGMKQLE